MDLRHELEDAERFTRRVEASVTWQVFQSIRGRVFSMIGETSLTVRAFRLLLRLGGLLMNRRTALPEPGVEAELTEAVGEPINLPTFERPTVSLVIPLYARADLTRRCLETIRDNTDQAGYEVILVDDFADHETKRLLEVVNGARILVNEQEPRLFTQHESRRCGRTWPVACVVQQRHRSISGVAHGDARLRRVQGVRRCRSSQVRFSRRPTE